jgi:acetyltransferase-like isoleucine patch superfamily enzyme
MSVKSKIDSRPRLKKIIHRMLTGNGANPRLWVKLFVNPIIIKRGKGSKIRWSARKDILPFNAFRLGAGSTIEDFCTINNGMGNVIIGQNTLIGMGNVIIGPVSIGNDVILAQNIVVSALNHDYRDATKPIREQKILFSPIVIEDECWIAANAVVTSGVTIGKHSVIGAGSVVTKSIPPYSVAVGNPARVIKTYNFDSNEWESVKR